MPKIFTMKSNPTSTKHSFCHCRRCNKKFSKGDRVVIITTKGVRYCEKCALEINLIVETLE